MAELVAEGKVRALGLSEVDVPDARARGGDPPGRRAAVGALAVDARRARRRAAVVHRARRRVRALRAARPRLPDRQRCRSTRPSARATSAAGTRASSPRRSTQNQAIVERVPRGRRRGSARRRRRSRSPGCSRRASTSSRSPAPSACATSRRTSAPSTSSSTRRGARRARRAAGARGIALLTMRPSPLRSELEAAGAVFAERSGHEVARDVRRPARASTRPPHAGPRDRRSQRARVRRRARPRRREAAAVARLERRRGRPEPAARASPSC